MSAWLAPFSDLFVLVCLFSIMTFSYGVQPVTDIFPSTSQPLWFTHTPPTICFSFSFCGLIYSHVFLAQSRHSWRLRSITKFGYLTPKTNTNDTSLLHHDWVYDYKLNHKNLSCEMPRRHTKTIASEVRGNWSHVVASRNQRQRFAIMAHGNALRKWFVPL